MVNVSIAMPEQMNQYIEERIMEGRYSNTGEYFRSLVREDQKRRTEECLEASLLRGLDSPASEWTPEDAPHIKQAVRERLAEAQQQG